MSITADKELYRLGEIPKISAIIQNASESEVELLPRLAGSDLGSRYPVAKYSIYRNDSLVLDSSLRCGNEDGLPSSFFLCLRPGETFDPNLQAKETYRDRLINGEAFKHRGKYRVRFFYSTNQDTLDRWIGWNSSLDLLTLSEAEYENKVNGYRSHFLNMPKVDLKSNVLHFEIQ